MDAVPPLHDDDRVTLRPVAADDWSDVVALEVAEAQRAFVAEPARYLALRAYGGPWNPWAVRLGDRAIGFVMWALDPDDGSCWLGGLLIDRRHQRKGHGRRAVEAALRLLAAEHGHRRFALSYHPDNPAKRLYGALGFQETGEVEGDEVVARLTVTGDVGAMNADVAAWSASSGPTIRGASDTTCEAPPQTVARSARSPGAARAEATPCKLMHGSVAGHLSLDLGTLTKPRRRSLIGAHADGPCNDTRRDAPERRIEVLRTVA